MDAEKKLIPDRVSTLLWGGLLAVFGVVLIAVFARGNDGSRFSVRAGEPPTIALAEGTEKLFTPQGIPEAPSLAPDGKSLAYATQVYKDDLFDYAIQSAWLAEPAADGSWRQSLLAGGRRTFFGEMETYFNPTFDAHEENVIMGSARFWNILGIPLLPTLRKALDVYPLGQGHRQSIVTPEELAIPMEALQHPKISPDGNWLAFYTRRRIESRGIYLLHLQSRKLYRISAEDDKHPTWTPDGKRLLFHYQRGGDALDPVPKDFPEQAYLGYFELSFKGEDDVSWRRFLIDPITDAYTYNKHPTLVPGTDLLFFHTRLSPKGRHLLMVRRLGVNTPVYLVSPAFEGAAMREIKHPAASVFTQELFFLGKAADEKLYSFYRLTDEALKTLQSQVR